MLLQEKHKICFNKKRNTREPAKARSKEAPISWNGWALY